MVAELVVGDSLTDAMVKAGAELIKQLDHRMQVRAALWYYIPEARTWRFVLGSPEVRVEGPRRAYKKVQAAVARLPERHRISLDNISVVDNNDRLISLLRQALQTGPGISGIRFSRSRIDDLFVEDAYIYRLTSP